MAGLRHQAYLRTRRPARVGVCVAGGDAELFRRILRRPKNAGKGEAPQLVVVVHAVQRDVALVRPAAVHCDPLRLSCSAGIRAGGDGHKKGHRRSTTADQGILRVSLGSAWIVALLVELPIDASVVLSVCALPPMTFTDHVGARG